MYNSHPSLPSLPLSPTSPPHPPSVPSPPSLPSLQQIHCPFQPKQSPSCEGFTLTHSGRRMSRSRRTSSYVITSDCYWTSTYVIMQYHVILLFKYYGIIGLLLNIPIRLATQQIHCPFPPSPPSPSPPSPPSLSPTSLSFPPLPSPPSPK